MPFVKRFIPKKTKAAMVERFNERFPAGPVREHAANATTIGGVVLVAAGALIGGKTGMGLRATGELADDVDGDIARALEIVSERGAKLDASIDKVKLVIEMLRLLIDGQKLPVNERRTRQAIIGFIAVKHSANATLNLYAEHNNLDAHSTKEGKANLWADGLTLGLFGLADVTENPSIKQVYKGLAYTSAAAGVVTGYLAIDSYIENYIRNPQPKVVEELAPVTE